LKLTNRLFVLMILFIAINIFSDKTLAQTVLITPDTLYMGQIPVGSKNVRQIKIFNLATSTLKISGLSLENDTDNSYKILNNPGSISLGQLQSIILQIEFSPSSNGLKQIELVIQSNASTSPDRRLLYGTGLTNSPPTFERVFGNEEDNTINSVQQTLDGGYILAGSTILSGEDFTDMYVVKTDSLGEIKWEKVFGGKDTETITEIIQTSDGNYMAFGNTDSKGAGGFDFYLVKLDPTGNIIWEKTYGGSRDERSADMIKTSDGGYLLLGSTLSFGDGLNSDVNVRKVSSDGTELWNKRFGGSNGDSGNKIIATQDGNYVILASSDSFGAGGFDIWLIKIDGNSGELWNKTYGGSKDEIGNGIVELPNGSLVIVGYTVSFGAGSRDIYIIKTNSSGSELWNKTDGGLYRDYATNIVSENDGIIYTTVKQSAPEVDSSTALINKADFDGNEFWQTNFSGGAADLILNNDKHIIIAGSTIKYGNKSEGYFLNVNQNGVITAVNNLVTQEPTTFKLFNNYPNPFNPITTIEFDVPKQSQVKLQIFNILGQKVATLVNDEYRTGRYKLQFNADGLASGVYFYKIIAGDFVQIKKMILLK